MPGRRWTCRLSRLTGLPKETAASDNSETAARLKSPSFLLVRKLVDASVLVRLARLQNGGREVGLVDRVWEVLRLQTNCASLGVRFAALSFLAEQEVARVKLNARLRRENGEDSARLGVV